MKKPVILNKPKAKERRRQHSTEAEIAAKAPDPAQLSARLRELGDAFNLLKPIIDSEASAARKRDTIALAKVQTRKNAVSSLLRSAATIVYAAHRAGMTMGEAERTHLLNECRTMLSSLQIDQRALSGARSAAHQRIQSLLQARQRAHGAILVYGPDGEGRVGGGCWSDRRDLSPLKA